MHHTAEGEGRDRENICAAKRREAGNQTTFS